MRPIIPRKGRIILKAQTAKRMIMYQEWAAQINACRQSGKTVRQWCNEHEINPKTFYNRMRVLREEMLELAETANASWIHGAIKTGPGGITAKTNQGYPVDTDENHTGEPIFTALPLPRSVPAAVTVRMGGYSIEIQNGADDATVEQALRLVARL